MSVEQRIKDALAPLGIPVEPDAYTGTETTYCIFRYNSVPDGFADNEPAYERYLIQVHLYSSVGTDTTEQRRQIKQLLYAADFTWPEEHGIPETERTEMYEGQHYMFACELAEGVGTDG